MYISEGISSASLHPPSLPNLYFSSLLFYFLVYFFVCIDLSLFSKSTHLLAKVRFQSVYLYKVSLHLSG